MGRSRAEAANKYQKNHYERINLLVPIGKKELIKNCAEGNGLSVNGFINQLIDEKLEKDGYGAGPSMRTEEDRKRGGQR